MLLATNKSICACSISADLLCFWQRVHIHPGACSNPYFVVATTPSCNHLKSILAPHVVRPILGEKQTFSPVIWMILSAIKRFLESFLSDSTPSCPVRMSCQCDGGATRRVRGRRMSLFCPTAQCMARSHTTFQLSKASGDISPGLLLPRGPSVTT